MGNSQKVVCPICGGDLLFCVKADSSLKRKINKNGKLSKVIHEGSRQLTDIYYLECDSYRCSFVYNITYPSMNEKECKDLNDWYDEFGEDFKQLI